MKQYINPDKCPTYASKKKETKELINIALFILDAFGMPMERSPRMLEKTAISFLACSDIKTRSDLKKAKDSESNFALGTKEIIAFVNNHFGESISRGSYDYIKRDALDFLTPAEIVYPASISKNTNDSTRGYSVNPFYADLIRSFGSNNWLKNVSIKLKDIEPLKDKLKRKRDLEKVEVKLPKGIKLSLSTGKHNELQKYIIEDFLSIFGKNSEVLYLGDSTDKYLLLETEKLKKLNFPKLSHDELPDIVAYSKKKNWLFLIEAVYSSGPIDELRYIQLEKITEKCTAEIIYVTAFLTREKFRKFAKDIAWETEVWIADNPEHLIHFNGDKFFGSYKTK